MNRLPIVDSKLRIKPSRMGRRRAFVLIAVHVLIAAHIVHWRMTGSSLTPVEPSEAMEFSKHSIVNAGLIFFAATILLTAVFGRFFCGWACHLVALQDLCRELLLKLGIRPKPFRSRLLRWAPAGAFVYMFFWPVAYRLWIGDSFLPLRAELTTSAFWETFPGWAVALATFVVCGFVIVYFLGAKGFCTYACPYGAIFGAVDRIAPVSIRVTDACEGCGHCTATCSSNVRVHEEVRTYGMVVDSGCMKCMDCVSVCPNDALYLGAGKPAALTGARPGASPATHRHDFTWGEETLLAGSFVAALVVFRGLYDLFPFLLSLGWAALLSYLTLQLYRLFTRPHLRIRSFALKRHGQVLPAGRGFLAIMAVLLIFWAHSAMVRYHEFLGERAYAMAIPLVNATIEQGAPPSLSGEQRDQVETALAHLRFLDRWALRGAPRVDVRQAWLHRLAGRQSEFRSHARRALAAAPGNATIRVELGNYYFRQGDGREAAEMYRQALSIEPRWTEAAVNLGALYAGEGEIAEAGAVFERALEQAPDSSQLHYNLAMVRIAFGRSAEAVAGFERALEIDPGFLEARENLAGYLCSLGRFEEGIVQYRKAIERSPEDAETHLLLARAYAGSGDFASARSQARRAIALNPALELAQVFLAELAVMERSGAE